MKRSQFNRRAAAAARQKNSAMLESRAILRRYIAQIQADGRRVRSRPPHRAEGKFGVYALHFELFDWGSVIRLRVVAPDGHKLYATLDAHTLEVVEC
jgi:hypothetical protein